MNSSNASPVAPTAVARIIPRSDHTISRSHISPNALRVLYKLRDAGFMAFLVGGCVRDLLIGLEPKDFDVVTDALPEQVKRLFRNCRLVGRRFRLAHVFFGREIIEVATFRAASAPSQGEEPLPDADPEDGEAPELDDPHLEAQSLGTSADEEANCASYADGNASPDAPANAGARANIDGAAGGARPFTTSDSDSDADTDVLTERRFDETGRLLRDNVYGTIDADVWRRDFTANSLYYNIADFSVWDYCGGVQDIAARALKLSGDPETRFR
ncbi:MAG: hypothetical protein ACREU6_17300, partial [Steroidobacteraceae bacterium]